MIVIADVAGQYDSLMRLLAKMPQERTVFLGDLIDRGPKSREVVAFVREKGHECVAANHEHFMIDWVRQNRWYAPTDWVVNGGRATLESYGLFGPERFTPQMVEDVEWMEKLPLYIETDRCFLSHAPWRAWSSLEDACRVIVRGRMGMQLPNDHSLLWCRDTPEDRLFKDADGLSTPPFGKRKIQVSGHNSWWGIRPFYVDENNDDDNSQLYLSANVAPIRIPEENLFAICIDNSMMKRTTGLHVDDETGALHIYQENY